MSYMESKMQDQIEGGIALQNAICDDACDIFKETGIMPLDMKMQRDELQAQLLLMKERNDALEKDAARYQWLRDNCTRAGVIVDVGAGAEIFNTIDDAIDAAMASQP